MCGIVGYVGRETAKPLLLEGLKRLEYRGYDSAGFALCNASSHDFVLRRAVGQVQSLVDATEKDGKTETQGIAHTRWATHGVPSETNAHPHLTGRVVLVHNGIIENYAEIKARLQKQGVAFVSQTDTEVFARLIETHREELCKGRAFDDLNDDSKAQLVLEALVKSMSEVEGHYAILLMVKGLEGKIFGVQNGAPLAIAKAAGGVLLASDLQPLVRHTREIAFIPQHTLFSADAQGYTFFEAKTLKRVEPKLERIDWSAEQVEKDGYEHFMLKEIYQQPLVVADTLSGRLPTDPQGHFVWDAPKAHDELWRDAKKVYLIACGTAYYAALVAKYYFEKWARIPVEVDVASEFRYRSPVFDPGTILGVISQSGETADTLAALRLANQSGIPTFSVCNVPGSTIMREARFHYPTKAGPEIGVASTKAFTAQLTVLCALAQDVGRLHKNYRGNSSALARLPHDLEILLSRAKEFEKVGASLKDKRTILFVGRGTMYPIALEGALKLKEITYRHAEGYPAGELKHGPIAMVDKALAAIVLAPTDELVSKTLSNLQEIKSREGVIIGLGEPDNEAFRSLCDTYIPMPKVDTSIAPMTYVVPLQLIAYGLAKELGCSIDKPRNLAKSVTVE